MQRADSLEKTLIGSFLIGKIEGRRRRGQQRMRRLDGITDSMDMTLSQFRETVKDREGLHSMGLQSLNLAPEQQQQHNMIRSHYQTKVLVVFHQWNHTVCTCMFIGEGLEESCMLASCLSHPLHSQLQVMIMLSFLSLNLCSCGSLHRGSHTQIGWMLAVPLPTGKLPYSLL